MRAEAPSTAIKGEQIGIRIALFNYWDQDLEVIYCRIHVNPWSTEIFNLNFKSLEVVSRYRDPQLQVTENLCDSRN